MIQTKEKSNNIQLVFGVASGFKYKMDERKLKQVFKMTSTCNLYVHCGYTSIVFFCFFQAIYLLVYSRVACSCRYTSYGYSFQHMLFSYILWDTFVSVSNPFTSPLHVVYKKVSTFSQFKVVIDF